jgi:hypothetical protein
MKPMTTPKKITGLAIYFILKGKRMLAQELFFLTSNYQLTYQRKEKLFLIQ